MIEDFAGLFENRMFMVIVDAHSKWIEFFPTKYATSMSTVVIDCLRSVFAVPNTVVTVNMVLALSVVNLRHT